MRGSIDDALSDLRQNLARWIASGAAPSLKIFVYPPEWEARMLQRFQHFAEECETVCPLELVELGHGYLVEIERRTGLVDRLSALERERPERPLGDLGLLAQQYLTRLLSPPPQPPAVARLLFNTGALATLVSYSAVANAIHDGGAETIAVPTVLAFPGEDDGRSLNLLRLRADTNYRVPRI